MIETSRLLLRNFKMTDSDDCFAILSDEQTCLDDGGFHAFEYRDEEYQRLMERFESQQNRYMIVLKETNRVIGTINLIDENRAVEAFELGYVIAAKYRRKGYASEAIQGVMDYYFTNTEVEMFTASCFPHNHASKHLLEKLGFQYEGIEHKGLYHATFGAIDLLCYYFDKPTAE